MTRDEHLAWCKKRALEYLDHGDMENAVASMGSDLEKHPETKVAPPLLCLGLVYVWKRDWVNVRRWIEGFR